jgi:cobalt/nickel transport system permease protein
LRDLYRKNQSFLHQLDARVKIIFTLAFILSINLTPIGTWSVYILFFTIILTATIISRLGVGFVFIRSLLAIPFLFAAIPLVFTGPDPYYIIHFLGGIDIQLSISGVVRFVSILLKSWISIQVAILLVATTRFPDLLIGLKQLKVPSQFVLIIGLMWRYLFLISDEVERMLRARASRSAMKKGRKNSAGLILWQARVTGGMAGNLFLRSLERSDRVYAAMLSRGYNGEPPLSNDLPISSSDKKVLISGVLILLLLLMFGLLSGG